MGHSAGTVKVEQGEPRGGEALQTGPIEIIREFFSQEGQKQKFYSWIAEAVDSAPISDEGPCCSHAKARKKMAEGESNFR
jgi:hypothetical protein